MKTFDEVYAALPARGWLSEAEARVLWACCEQTHGPILEVGCFRGRSTVLLAQFGRPVLCVDPFAGFDSDDPSGEDARKAFVANVTDAGFSAANGIVADAVALPDRFTGDTVFLYKQRVEDWTPRPVDLAYLDGDHTFEGTLAQINKALMCGPLVIACHDYNDDGEGLKVKLACDERLGKPKHRAERLAVWGAVKL